MRFYAAWTRVILPAARCLFFFTCVLHTQSIALRVGPLGSRQVQVPKQGSEFLKTRSKRKTIHSQIHSQMSDGRRYRDPQRAKPRGPDCLRKTTVKNKMKLIYNLPHLSSTVCWQPDLCCGTLFNFRVNYS